MSKASKERDAKREVAMKEQAERENNLICGRETKSGATCSRPAGWGRKVKVGPCRFHTGQPLKRLREAKAEVNGMAVPHHVSPAEALQAAMNLAAGQLAYATARVAGLREDEMYFEYMNWETGIPQILPNVWLVVQDKKVEQLAGFAEKAARAGIAERDQALREAQTAVMGALIKEITERLALTPAQKKRVAPAIREAMPVVLGTAREIEP